MVNIEEFLIANGDYWQSLYCWPTATVEHQGRLGVVVPFYASNFFFEHGSQQNDMLGIKAKKKKENGLLHRPTVNGF